MLDYYGSITLNENDIKERIYSHFHKYPKVEVERIVNSLFEIGIISPSYSVSGWNMFFKKEIIDHVDKRYKIQQKKTLAELMDADIIMNDIGQLILQKMQ